MDKVTMEQSAKQLGWLLTLLVIWRSLHTLWGKITLAQCGAIGVRFHHQSEKFN
jgi:hypothetical protein